MLITSEIEKAVILQQKSYQLLKWMAELVRSGIIDFTSAHGFSDLPSAALEWMVQHYENLPAGARSSQEDLPQFAAFFSTYLLNSFELLNRMKGVANGPSVLALWRGFAWTAQGSPKKNFTLTADRIMNAQSAILASNPSNKNR